MNPRRWLGGGAAVALVAAAMLVVVSGIETSSARFEASTDADGTFGAARVVLDSTGSSRLLFDADGLFPGLVRWGCVEIRYDGSVPASVRLHAAPVGGSGLERFLLLDLWVAQGPACDDIDPSGPTDGPADAAITPTSGGPVYSGLLSDVWVLHPDYADGLQIDRRATDGTTISLIASVQVVDDDEAQGLDTDFDLIVEARP